VNGYKDFNRSIVHKNSFLAQEQRLLNRFFVKDLGKFRAFLALFKASEDSILGEKRGFTAPDSLSASPARPYYFKLALKRVAIIIDKEEERCKMKRLQHSKKTSRSKRLVYGGLDSHKWATKMEIRRLLSGKPDLRIKVEPKTSKQQPITESF